MKHVKVFLLASTILLVPTAYADRENNEDQTTDNGSEIHIEKSSNKRPDGKSFREFVIF